MKTRMTSGLTGFAVGLALAAAGAQAAAEATQHDHAPAPQAQTPAAPGAAGMKDMRAMMADPVMRARMMANMTQCRDMMTMMMEHMKQDGMKTQPPRQ